MGPYPVAKVGALFFAAWSQITGAVAETVYADGSRLVKDVVTLAMMAKCLGEEWWEPTSGEQDETLTGPEAFKRRAERNR
jgi:hypothetical protein